MRGPNDNDDAPESQDEGETTIDQNPYPDDEPDTVDVSPTEGN